MGRIQASTGLVTGIDIQGTVDKLMALEAKPRDTLTARLKTQQSRQAALTGLTASVLGVQLSVKNIAKDSVFNSVAVTSSKSTLVAASKNSSSTPATGNYQFTPLQQAQAEQQLSRGFSARTSTVGAGTLTIRPGAPLDDSIALADLNGGDGVQRGKIRITDRGGKSAVVDLRFAYNVNDVVAAINNQQDANVTAKVVNDRIQLTDHTGLTTANLRVQDLGGTKTATDLGLGQIDVAASSATGSDIHGLYGELTLQHLNDGQGLSFNQSLPDLKVTFRDGTSLNLDFARVGKDASVATGTTNAASGLSGDISLTALATGAAADGVRLKFVDSGTVTAGHETVAYDAQAKTLTVDIAGGATTATNVINAINHDTTASGLFAASHPSGSDGTGLVNVNDAAVLSGGAAVTAKTETTLKELLETINAADPTRLSAEISSDGDRLVFHDLTADHGGSFSVTDLYEGTLAGDLGITGAVGDTITGKRLLGGLQSPLLHTLNGGRGLGNLGTLQLTDRSGATATVNLANAETLDDVINGINQAGLGIRAEVNEARNGLRIADTTGATTSSLIVASGDVNNTAEKLGIAVNAAKTSFEGSRLNRQTYNEGTLLADLNGGDGVGVGSFTITDSAGNKSSINLRTLGSKTLGDVIDSINDLTIGVKARINDTGDGLVLIDTAGGTGKLIVQDSGSAGSAKKLKIAGESSATTIDGQSVQAIDGSQAIRVTLTSTDTVDDLIKKINDVGGDVSASLFTDRSSVLPYRVSLTSSDTGRRGSFTVDDGGLGLGLSISQNATDALVAIGNIDQGNSAVVASSTNTFTNVVDGLNITLKDDTRETVTVNVAADTQSIVTKVKSFVDQYNKLQEKLDSVDYYNTSDNTKGILFGSVEALRVSSDLSSAISKRYFANSTFQYTSALGLSLDSSGKLSFDSSKLESALAKNPDEVKSFFLDETKGFGKTFDRAAENLVGQDNSTLINSANASQTIADSLQDRITKLSDRLTRRREALLKQFYNLETAVSKIQNTFGSIQSSLTNAASLASGK